MQNNGNGIEKPEKREIVSNKKTGITVTDILIVSVLIAAGAVLKAFSNTIFAFTPLKPNMVIAMYALAILLIRPKIYEAFAIGLIAGIICMFLPGATPYANIASEAAGALVMALLIKIPLKINAGKISFRPAVLTFFTTLASGYTFFVMLQILLLSGMEIKGMALGVFNGIILGTAAVNAVIVSALYPALRAVIRSEKK
ncbi:MAG: hypothetical protein FWH24_06015 [Oscillospiraceae bacterium]|nr:hypothetical protein [Oscillospiraceae bacterium]